MVTIKCTYCGGTEFHEGPSGGGSTNILCANPQCRHWFNHNPFFKLEDLNKIEPTQDERKDIFNAENQRRRAEYAQFHSEGAAMYHAGIPVLETAKDQLLNQYNLVTHADYFRLLGWIDAQTTRIKL